MDYKPDRGVDENDRSFPFLCATAEGEPGCFAAVPEAAGAAQLGKTVLAAQRHAGTALGPGGSHREQHW